jgi:hypothetical protein
MWLMEAGSDPDHLFYVGEWEYRWGVRQMMGGFHVEEI